MRKTLSLFLFLGLLTMGYSQKKYTISGYLSDADSGEKLISANIIDLNTEKGTSSNLYGFYSLTLPQDSVTLAFSYIGYGTVIKKFLLKKDTQINVALAGSVSLETVEVNAEKINKIEEQTQMSKVTLPVEQLKRLPALLGEVDVLRAIQLLPGVQSGNEGQTGLYVRGGSPDQNLVLLDGVTVYNVAHVFGIFSVFIADAIRNISLTKGGFPARYGGRLSSVLEINMKEGNMKKFSGEGSLGLISSKLTVEGPIIKDKSSFILSGRRTYLDLVAAPFIALSNRSNPEKIHPRVFFYDLNAKVNYKINDQHRVYLSAYNGSDVLKIGISSTDAIGNKDEINSGLDWGNIISALRWNYKLNNRLFSNVTATYSKYKLKTGAEIKEESSQGTSGFTALYISGIEDLGLKWDFDYIPAPAHYVKFGASSTRHRYSPGALSIEVEDTNYKLDTAIGNKDLFSTEYDAYIEDDITLGAMKANVGLHYSLFDVQGKRYQTLQPRIGMRYLLPDRTAVKASFNTMTQYINLLTSESFSLPTDLWVPSTRKVKPQKSWQVALGAAKTVLDNYEISLEGYYKEMKNVISYKPGASYLLGISDDWQDKITQGKGRSYGLELLLQKKFGRFNGLIGYTLSWNKRKFDLINGGEEFPYRYDRRHDISMVANYKITNRWSFSSAWVFGTGNAVSIPVYENAVHTKSVDRNNPYNPFVTIQGAEKKNAFRLSNYHRLDLSLSYHTKHKKWESTWVLGVYNAYWHKNPYFLYVDRVSNQDANGTITTKNVYKEVSLLPVIPSISYQFKF